MGRVHINRPAAMALRTKPRVNFIDMLAHDVLRNGFGDRQRNGIVVALGIAEPQLPVFDSSEQKTCYSKRIVSYTCPMVIAMADN